MSSVPASGASIHEHVQQVLFGQQELAARIAELGRAISLDYAGQDLILVGVLQGVVLFMADLLRQITTPVQVDFMSISRYASSDTSGRVQITKDLEQSIEGRHVLFVEDVIDTGLTLNYLLRTLETRRPASLRVCVLFDRPYRRLIDIPVTYQGFVLPDLFVVGYGLDVDGYYRNLPFVGILKEDADPHNLLD